MTWFSRTTSFLIDLINRWDKLNHLVWRKLNDATVTLANLVIVASSYHYLDRCGGEQQICNVLVNDMLLQ